MSCNHHPGAELLLQYASGQIDGVHRLMLDMHTRVCSQCAQTVAELEAIGGELLEHFADAPVSMSFDDLMKKISDTEAVPMSEVSDDVSDYQKVVEHILSSGDSTSLNWHWRTQKFAEIPLAINDGAFESKLIYFKKGMKVPRHTHRKEERTLVLHGSFSDETGLYKRGDYVCRTAAHEHSPRAESDCVCLAITSAPLKFTGTFGPILNLFLN